MSSGQSCSRYSLIYYFGRNCRFVTHYYAKGDHCEESGKQRDVQLRFKYVVVSIFSAAVCIIIPQNPATIIILIWHILMCRYM